MNVVLFSSIPSLKPCGYYQCVTWLLGPHPDKPLYLSIRQLGVLHTSKQTVGLGPSNVSEHGLLVLTRDTLDVDRCYRPLTARSCLLFKDHQSFGLRTGHWRPPGGPNLERCRTQHGLPSNQATTRLKLLPIFNLGFDLVSTFLCLFL